MFSLVVQGLTLEPLIRMLGLQRATVPDLYVRGESQLSAKSRARSPVRGTCRLATSRSASFHCVT